MKSAQPGNKDQGIEMTACKEENIVLCLYRFIRLCAASLLREELTAEDRADLSFVWEAVKSLPETAGAVLHLYYYEGCKAAEIAQILGRSESTVRSDLKRGRERLREILKEEYDFE